MSDSPDRVPEARVRQQEVVAEIGRRALAGERLDALLRYASEGATAVLGSAFGEIVQLDGREGVSRARAGFRGDEPRTRQPSAGERSQIKYVTASEGAALLNLLEPEDRFEPDPYLTGLGLVSGASVVITGNDRPWGVIGVYDLEERAYGPADLHFLQVVGEILGYAIARQRMEDRLRDSEAHARAVLDTTVDGIITIDDRGRITSFNLAAENIFGYQAEEVLGENVSVLMPEPYHSEHDDYLQSYRETGRRKIIGIGREVTGRRKDGSTFPLDLAVSEVELQGRTVFSGLIRDISERRRLELEVLRISDDERRRIGQDLHDGLGQQLTGIGLISRSLARNLEREGSAMAPQAEEVTRLIREADELARQLARGLVPVDLGAEGLTIALERLAQNATGLFHVACSFEATIDSPKMLEHREVATHLYRIAQEALSNGVRHGQATQVTISLVATDGRVRLLVRDDGVGIPDEILNAKTEVDGMAGMGLRIMDYRARIIGGSVDIRTGASGGTVVTCTIPPSSDSPALRKASAAADASLTTD